MIDFRSFSTGGDDWCETLFYCNNCEILYYITKKMQDQNDNMTETRGSIEGSVTFWGKFRSILCPCFKAKAESSTSKRDDNTVGLKIS
jgi:hypothetical protein